MKAITLSAEQTQQWARDEHLAQGPDDLPAKTIRRARAILANHPEQDRCHVYAGEPLGNHVILTVSRTGVSAGQQVKPALDAALAFQAIRYIIDGGAETFDLNELISELGGIVEADRCQIRAIEISGNHAFRPFRSDVFVRVTRIS